MDNGDINRAIHYFQVVIARHYADFNGRVTRRDFWTYFAVYAGIAVIATILQAVAGLGLASLLHLVLLPPTAGMTARRLQDTGNNGQLAWLLFVPWGISNLVIVLIATSFGALGILLLLLPLMGVLVLIALVAAIYLLYLCIQPGTPGTNAYGPQPISAA